MWCPWYWQNPSTPFSWSCQSLDYIFCFSFLTTLRLITLDYVKYSRKINPLSGNSYSLFSTFLVPFLQWHLSLLLLVLPLLLLVLIYPLLSIWKPFHVFNDKWGLHFCIKWLHLSLNDCTKDMYSVHPGQMWTLNPDNFLTLHISQETQCTPHLVKPCFLLSKQACHCLSTSANHCAYSLGVTVS